MSNLTKKQKEVFDFINSYLSENGIAPTIEEIRKKLKLEADFAAFWQDSIYGEKNDGVLFGECKTYGKFKKEDFDRIKYLAKKFPGAVLVFSTLRKSLTTQEIKSITSIAKKGRKEWKPERPINPVLILTGNELLSDFGPPYCWEDSLKKKFDRVASHCQKMIQNGSRAQKYPLKIDLPYDYF